MNLQKDIIIVSKKELFPEINDIIKSKPCFDVKNFSNNLFKLSIENEEFIIEAKNLSKVYKLTINETNEKFIASILIRIIKGIFTVIFCKKSIINTEIESNWHIYTEKNEYIKDFPCKFFVPYKDSDICKLVNNVNSLANLSVNNIYISAALLVWGLDYRVGVDYGKIIEVLENDVLKNDDFRKILSAQDINLKKIKTTLNKSIDLVVGRHLNDNILSDKNQSDEYFTLNEIENKLFILMNELLEFNKNNKNDI